MKNAYQLPHICGNWSLHAGHKKAQVIIDEIGDIMQLKPAVKDSRHIHFQLFKKNNSIHFPENLEKKKLTFSLPEPKPSTERYALYIHLSSLMSILAAKNGAILVHAALAEKNGHGALFMGPGDVGKTTMTRRLPSPWRAMCDDTTLLYIEDDKIYAHAWPTWSRFTMDCPGGSWNVNDRVALQGMFLLKQSQTDKVQPLDKQQSFNALTQSILQIGHTTFRRMSPQGKNDFVQSHIQILQNINNKLDSFLLENTLTGKVENEIAEVWSPKSISQKEQIEKSVRMQEHAIYVGPSMFPVFRNPEYVTVQQYNHIDEIQKGDVIYFKSPIENKNIIHRVIAKKKKGVKTRGDNNPINDPYWVSFTDIYGRITYSTFKGNTRAIAGGTRGMLLFRKNIIRRQVLLALQAIKQKHATIWKELLSIGKFFVRKKELHIIEFQQKRYPDYKLFLNNKWIGQYNPIRQKWTLHGAYRFLIDRSKLPCPEINL